MRVEFMNDFFQIVIPTFWLLSILALIYDRYFLMNKRVIDLLFQKTKEEGRCVVCKRPIRIIPDEQDHG